jgi:hypothetical protein
MYRQGDDHASRLPKGVVMAAKTLDVVLRGDAKG